MVHPILNQPYFHCERAAFAYLEAQVWPIGPVCPQPACQLKSTRVRLLNKTRKNTSKEKVERVTRLGIYKCYHCCNTFTVRKGTVFEGSHFPLHLWLQVIHLAIGSRKAITTLKLQCMLACSRKTAWALSRRIRALLKRGETRPHQETKQQIAPITFEPDNPAQSRRFLELAAEVGAHGVPDDLERAIKILAP